jgi:tyrosyl-tRNA synthetase
MDIKQKIEEVLTRSVDTVYPSKEVVAEALSSGKKMRIYMGIDPTATYVHLGHSTNYIILKRFHELGHKVIVLIGDFTAMIGDPSDKSAARKKLTKEDVENNLKTFKEQIGKILDFENKENPIEFRFNSEWLAKLTFEDSVSLASHFTVQQMIERDTFQKRLKDQKPLYVHEFFYPLMQGYDSVALDADIEIGGTDQTFNMLAGRTLVKAYQQKEKFVIATTLLENPVTGEKLMSKSLGTGIGIDEDQFAMYTKVMQLPDEAILQCFIDCTYISMNEIQTLENRIKAGENPRDIKMILADEIVKIYHGEEASKKAQEYFVQIFNKKEVAQEGIVEVLAEGKTLEDILVQENIVSSKSDLRRLVESGSVSNFETKEIVSLDQVKEIATPAVYKIGKSRIIRIV